MSRNVKDKTKYTQIRAQRLEYKHVGDPRQAPLKIILNSTYGILNDKFSPMYDPRQAHRVCVYNQLFLLDLIEKIEIACGDKAELIQSNTDGIYFQVQDTETAKIIDECVDEWCRRTRYEMELDMANKIVQRDVNSYVLVTSKGKVKCKGAIKQPKPLDNDLPIVKKALKAYLVDGTPIEDYIHAEDNLIEYQKIYKTTANYKYAYHNETPIKNKVNRVFASKDENDTPFYKWKKDKDKPDKFASTPDHVFLINDDIRGVKVPDKLDKEWYIDATIAELKKFTGEIYVRKEEINHGK